MKKIFTFALILLFASFSLYSQYYFYVRPSNETARATFTERGLPSNEVLNQVFREFEVKSFRQSFPGAQNPLARVCSGCCTTALSEPVHNLFLRLVISNSIKPVPQNMESGLT